MNLFSYNFLRMRRGRKQASALNLKPSTLSIAWTLPSDESTLPVQGQTPFKTSIYDSELPSGTKEDTVVQVLSLNRLLDDFLQQLHRLRGDSSEGDTTMMHFIVSSSLPPHLKQTLQQWAKQISPGPQPAATAGKARALHQYKTLHPLILYAYRM